jgi:hypothetical protein
MAYITLEVILCEKTQEAVDEPYLRIIVDEGTPTEDRTTWGPVPMNDGETRPIDILPKVFYETIRIELWERDRIGRDDRIGVLALRASDASSGGQHHRFEGRLARYTLTYVVNPSHAERFALHLVSLRCNDAQEATDEPYLVVNGATVWGHASMRTGQLQDLGPMEVDFSPARNARIELWERDAARSDHIGTLEITESMARTYAADWRTDRSHVFSRDRGIVGDARYTLTYRVSIVPVPPVSDPDAPPR